MSQGQSETIDRGGMKTEDTRTYARQTEAAWRRDCTVGHFGEELLLVLSEVRFQLPSVRGIAIALTQLAFLLSAFDQDVKK